MVDIRSVNYVEADLACQADAFDGAHRRTGAGGANESELHEIPRWAQHFGVFGPADCALRLLAGSRLNRVMKACQ